AQQQAALPMLLGFVHEVSRHPDQAIGAAIDNAARHEAAGTIARELEHAQRDVSKLRAPSKGGISALLGKSIDHGLDTQIRSIIADRDEVPQPLGNGFVIPCRTAAFSMLQEAEEHARYGWTHALTLPQAVLGLSGHFVDPASALLASNLYASAYQAIIAEGKIAPDAKPEPTDLGFAEALFRSPELAAAAGWHLAPGARAAAFDLLATEASIRPDCHGVKYALATRQAA
ncbi:MAG: hypothetical protein GY844_35585, partial [Bradyrhizobium sp.]|nr:hypothetical protein [Bradyrhizobium sp.]